MIIKPFLCDMDIFRGCVRVYKRVDEKVAGWEATQLLSLQQKLSAYTYFFRKTKRLGRKSPQEKINAPPYRDVYI